MIFLGPMRFLLSLFLILASLPVWAQTYPETYRYQILTTDKTTSTVNKVSFVTIPNVIVALHFKDIQKARASVVVNADWVKPYFTAWAHQEKENQYSLNFWGGLARIPGMNDEGMALTACHELGHVLGGTPKIKIKEFLWSSAEGQSDYYASAVCLKNYFKHVHQQKKLTIPSKLSETAFTLCRTTYSNETDFLVCLNTNKGIEAFANVLMHLSQYKEQLDIDTPSKNKVTHTMYDSYPETQCRIDTLVLGSLGQPRPGCWYK